MNVMKCMRIREKRCNCLCFEIDQEMDAILLKIGIVYGVCRIVIKSVQQCIYFLFSVTDKEPCKFVVNKWQNTNYSFLPVTSKVSCIRRKRGQIICLQGNYKSMVIFVLKRRSGTISCLMWNTYLYFTILKLFTHFQNI